MTSDLSSLTCWIVTPNGLIGTENQCIGVAEALGVPYILKRVKLNQPWRGLTPYLRFESQFCFSSKGDKIEPPWPDLVIAAGRRAIPAARYIRRMSSNKSFVVFLQNPHCDTRSFDLVAAPYHDKVKGSNVIETVGAANRITADLIAEEKKKFAHLFDKLPSPRVAVLLGGNSKTHRLTTDITLKFCNQLKELQNIEGCSLMITASRRTGDRNAFLLRQKLAPLNNSYFWDGKTDNPYLGMLAWADYIIVSEDSVSMLCDAATVGKPVYKLSLEGRSNKFDRFYKALEDRNITKPFTGNLEHWDYDRLQDAQFIARNIIERLINHGKV